MQELRKYSAAVVMNVKSSFCAEMPLLIKITASLKV